MNLSAAVPIHIMELKKSEKLKNGNSFPLIPQEAQRPVQAPRVFATFEKKWSAALKLSQYSVNTRLF